MKIPQISGRNENNLKDNLPTTIEDPGAPGREEGAEREDELHHVVPECLEGVPGRRGLVGEVSEWVWVWLCLVEVVHAGEISPALVPPDLDEPGPQHDPEYQPPVAVHTDLAETETQIKWLDDKIFSGSHLWRWQTRWHLPPGPERNTPDGEEASLQQLTLPAKREPGLTHTDL